MSETHLEITDKAVAELRERLGKTWRPLEPYWNTQATKDAIRHFANGIGDINPLWRSEEYARRTSWGAIIAPPAFLYSVYWPAQGRGMPGIHAWHSGDDWHFYKPIMLGDEFTYTNTLVDVVEKTSHMAGKTVIQFHRITYENQRGEMVAECLDWCTRAGRQSAKEQGKYSEIPKAKYCDNELLSIYNDYSREEICGAKRRYWEEVNAGDELVPVVKGPLSLRDIFAWLMGAGSPFMRAHGIALSFTKRHPGAEMMDSATGLADVPELVHVEDSRAEEIGLPGAYDYGPQRISWLGHLLTNWMGDEGVLKRLRGELRRFNVVGDTTWCKGRVAKKYVETGEHLVDIDCWAENQRAEKTLLGQATIALPHRAAPEQ